jgi:predicted SAM-dependent methyltransferase
MNPIRLHVGCGGVRWRDFVNVDLYPYQEGTIDFSRDGCVADVFAYMRDLGLPDNSVDEIFSSHTIDISFCGRLWIC